MYLRNDNKGSYGGLSDVWGFGQSAPATTLTPDQAAAVATGSPPTDSSAPTTPAPTAPGTSNRHHRRGGHGHRHGNHSGNMMMFPVLVLAMVGCLAAFYAVGKASARKCRK